MPRTAAQYLSDHSNDAEAALAAAVADVNAAHGENATARRFRRDFEPILRELDIPSTQDGVELLRERLTAASQSADVEDLLELVQDMQGLLGELGIDFDAPEAELGAALEALPERWQAGQTAITERDTLRQDTELTTLAGQAKVNAAVFKDLVKRDGLTPKLQGEGDKQAVHLFDKDGKDLGPVKDYAEKTPAWKDYSAALFPSTTPQGGTVVSPQAGAGAGAAGAGISSYAAKALAQRQAAANPNPTQEGKA